MDLNSASQFHSEWKVKLRQAISNRETLDAATISKDTCCALGKWLHGEAKAQSGKVPAHGNCVAKHADFQREAGKVATAINAAEFERADKMLDAGTP